MEKKEQTIVKRGGVFILWRKSTPPLFTNVQKRITNKTCIPILGSVKAERTSE